MNDKRVLKAIVLVLLLVLLPAGSAGGQEEPPAVSAALGTGFTYQGWLQDSTGAPVSDTCDLRFSLWGAATGGSQVGSDCTVAGVQVADGYFTATVNAGYEFGPNAFLGDARWLQVAVQCSADTRFVTLSPRQALTPAPYALTLRPGAAIVGQVPGDASMLWVGNQATSGRASALHGQSTSASARAVQGIATAGSGTTNGVYGEAQSTSGAGVSGYAGADSGTTFGVYGMSKSPRGRGVQGFAAATSGANWGLYGQTNSSDGGGVYGYAQAASGENYGVYGHTNSSDGRAVYGYAGARSGTNYGVRGGTNSKDGYGGYFGNSAGGTALHVEGDATQSLAGNGLVKAAVHARCGPPAEVYRWFDTVNGWLAYSAPAAGQCRFDFDFDLGERFWIVMPTIPRTVATCYQADTNILVCWVYDLSGDPESSNIMLLVY